MSVVSSVQSPINGERQEVETTSTASMAEDVLSKESRWRGQLFWILQITSWSGAALLTIFVANTEYFGIQDAVLFGSLRSAFGFAATCGIRYVYRSFRRAQRHFWLTAIAIFLLCGLLGVTDAAFITLCGYMLGLDLTASAMKQFMAGGVVMRWMLYWLWSLSYFGINYWLDTKHAQLKLSQVEASARASELQLLRAQINPHFLFNALNSIMAEAENPTTVQNLTQALSDYLRFSLQQRGDIQRLGVELDALENYLCVEKARFEENLEYLIQADVTARHALAPIALVQPLLDNSIKYGQRSAIRPLRLTISAKVMDDELTIMVINSGSWIIPGTVASTGTGLTNLRRRLQILYEGAASVKVESDEESVCVTVRIPVLKEK